MLPVELDRLIAASSLTTSFVVDEFGQVVNSAGSSSGIGNQSDKLLLRALRANAQVVLTSGKTARADNYRMPRTADLAIFTNRGAGDLELIPKENQRLTIFGSDKAPGFAAAIDYLKTLGYQRIHVEFGLTGFSAIKDQLDLVVLSTVSGNGLEVFTRQQKLEPIARFELPELEVWVC